MSGGTETHTDDTARISVETTPTRLPLTTPRANPTAAATMRATTARTAVLSAAGASTAVTGRP